MEEVPCTSTYLYDGDNSDKPSALELLVKLEMDTSEEVDLSLNWPNDSENISYEPLELNSTDAMLDSASGLYYCLHCCTEMPLESLNMHMIEEHGYRSVKYKCIECNEKFSDKDLYKIHKSNGHSKEVLLCPVCNREVKKNFLSKHIKNIHSSPDYTSKCDECGNIFKNKVSLREHKSTVHSKTKKPVNCPQCNQEFHSRKYLTNHLRNVHPKGDRNHKCDSCPKIFKSRICLHQHIKYVHPPETASAKCSWCNKTYKTKANLAQHVRCVHPEQKYGKKVLIK